MTLLETAQPQTSLDLSSTRKSYTEEQLCNIANADGLNMRNYRATYGGQKISLQGNGWIITFARKDNGRFYRESLGWLKA